MVLCKFCKKEFSSYANMTLHLDICQDKQNVIVDELYSHIKILEEILKDKILEIENKDRLIDTLFKKLSKV